MTTAEYVEKVYQRVSKGKPQEAVGVYRWSIEAGLPQALKLLAKKIADDRQRANLLQKTFGPLTLVGGEITLSTEQTMLQYSIPKTGRVTLSGVTNSLAWLPTREDLEHPPFLSDWIFYTLFENKILCRTHTGAVPSATSLTIFANYIPTISEVTADELEDDLEDIGVMLTIGAPANA